jgi:phosphoserine aminotransferase
VPLKDERRVSHQNRGQGRLTFVLLPRFPHCFMCHFYPVGCNNVPQALESKFVTESTAQGLIGLEGHRSVGGLRASLYNAVTLEACEALAEFMRQFQSKHTGA